MTPSPSLSLGFAAASAQGSPHKLWGSLKLQRLPPLLSNYKSSLVLTLGICLQIEASVVAAWKVNPPSPSPGEERKESPPAGRDRGLAAGVRLALLPPPTASRVGRSQQNGDLGGTFSLGSCGLRMDFSSPH